MHIHPNNNLQLASLGFAREETQAIQAKRAGEVRRKLSSASRELDDTEEFYSPALQVGRRSYGSEPGQREGDSFGRLFSAKA